MGHSQTLATALADWRFPFETLRTKKSRERANLSAFSDGSLLLIALRFKKEPDKRSRPERYSFLFLEIE